MVRRPSRGLKVVERPSQKAGSGREALKKIREWSGGLSVGREWSEGPRGRSKVIGNGWEAHPKGWEWS